MYVDYTVTVLLITVLCMLIGLYVVTKRAINLLFSEENIQNVADSVLEYVTNTEEGQKKLYTIGALIGSGVKQGIGIQKQGGKGGFNGLIGQIIAGFFQGQGLGAPPEEAPMQETRQVGLPPARKNASL